MTGMCTSPGVANGDGIIMPLIASPVKAVTDWWEEYRAVAAGVWIRPSWWIMSR